MTWWAAYVAYRHKVRRTICTKTNRRPYVCFQALSKGPALADRIPSTTRFHHRLNDDRTFDSICPCCFRTVGSGMEESQLAEFERNHICEDRFIPTGSSEVS
jgi:hypothetical protein